MRELSSKLEASIHNNSNNNNIYIYTEESKQLLQINTRPTAMEDAGVSQ